MACPPPRPIADPNSFSFHALSARYLVKEEVKKFKRPDGQGHYAPANWNGDFNSIQEDYRPVPKKSGDKPKVCIIGAGSCGLRIAMFLQYLKIDFDILEASDRHGGRAFTYHFSAAKHDYFDVAAMRFPDTRALQQTYKLFEELRLWEEGKVIPYIMSIPENLQLFNNTLVTNKIASTEKDPHRDSPPIPMECLTYTYGGSKGASAIAAKAMEKYKVALADDFQTGWVLLMTKDRYTTREVMREFVREHVLKKPFTDETLFWVVQWMERMNNSTQSYSNSFAEEVLESMEFDYPGGSGNPRITAPSTQEWRCLDGGTEVLTDAMQQSITKKLNYNHRVVAIRAGLLKLGPPEMFVEVQGRPEFKDKPYAHVVVTTTLSCMSSMDLTNAQLSYFQKDGIRSLSYGAAVKIGIKFKTRWWQNIPNFQQKGGVSYTDRPIRVVVYPSYGFNEDPNDSAVLIASYTWTQDASRLGADIQGNNTMPEQHLLDIVYNNLAALHNVGNLPVDHADYRSPHWYKDQTISHFAFDWYHNEYTAGAYAQFLPGQYSNQYPWMTRPAAFGHLHISGEAMSAHHAWIEGALVAAWRSVYHILLFNGDPIKVAEFVSKWPPPDEIDLEQEPLHAALALENYPAALALENHLAVK